MNIIGIKIENIKGIKSHDFNITLFPNKPNILVAPNGFGKSSFAIAFDSLHESKIILEEKNWHLGNSALIPKIEISTSTGKHLWADNTSNNIDSEFDIFVINNPLLPKANAKTYLGRLISRPTIEIKPTILVHTIPPKKDFKYKLPSIKRFFGNNNKVLPDISFLLKNGDVMADIASLDLARIKTLKWKRDVDTFVNDINSQKGTAQIVEKYINENVTNILQVGPYPLISDIFIKHGVITPDQNAQKFLYTWQIWQLYLNLGVDFKKGL